MARLWDQLGALVFRLRGLLPLPLGWLIVSVSWDDHVAAGWGGAQVDAWLDVGGVLLCVIGSSLRLVTVATVPPGTSSGARRFQSHALTTTGMYRVVRHPLYLGNFFITLGLLCVAHEPWGYVLGLGYFVFTHALIVRAEEQLLAKTYPQQWPAFAAEVPQVVPRLTRLGHLRGPFGWKRAVQREVNPLVAWGLGVTFLMVWERFVRNELSPELARRLGAVALGLLTLLVLNKVWKKVSRA